MSKILKEITKHIPLPKGGTRQEILEKLIRKCGKPAILDDDAYNSLSDEAQTWINEGVALVKAKKSIPDPDGKEPDEDEDDDDAELEVRRRPAKLPKKKAAKKKKAEPEPEEDESQDEEDEEDALGPAPKKRRKRKVEPEPEDDSADEDEDEEDAPKKRTSRRELEEEFEDEDEPKKASKKKSSKKASKKKASKKKATRKRKKGSSYAFVKAVIENPECSSPDEVLEQIDAENRVSETTANVLFYNVQMIRSVLKDLGKEIVDIDD